MMASLSLFRSKYIIVKSSSNKLFKVSITIIPWNLEVWDTWMRISSIFSKYLRHGFGMRRRKYSFSFLSMKYLLIIESSCGPKCVPNSYHSKKYFMKVFKIGGCGEKLVTPRRFELLWHGWKPWILTIRRWGHFKVY